MSVFSISDVVGFYITPPSTLSFHRHIRSNISNMCHYRDIYNRRVDQYRIFGILWDFNHRDIDVRCEIVIKCLECIRTVVLSGD